MSTKVSIKHRGPTNTQPGYLLYDDVLDTFGQDDAQPEPPVYLRLDGVSVLLETLSRGGASVTVTLPREIARELGLLPQRNADS
jgi:hypothetical protein